MKPSKAAVPHGTGKIRLVFPGEAAAIPSTVGDRGGPPCVEFVRPAILGADRLFGKAAATLRLSGGKLTARKWAAPLPIRMRGCAGWA